MRPVSLHFVSLSGTKDIVTWLLYRFYRKKRYRCWKRLHSLSRTKF